MTEQAIKKKTIKVDKTCWISILATIGLFLICFAFFKVRYEDNDDFLISLIARGYLTGTPDSHLFYINSLLGNFLSTLYSFNNSFDWYGILILLFQFVSIVSIFYGLLTANLHKHLLVFLVSIPLAYFIINSQFTSTAFLLAFAGLLLLETVEPETYLGYAFPFVLFFLSALVRVEVLAFTLIIGSVFFLKTIITKKRYWSVVILIIAIGITQWIHRTDYQTNDWKTFKEYVTILPKVLDNPNTFWNLEQASEAVKIPKKEFDLLFRFVLTENFNQANLESIYDVSNSSSNKLKGLQEFPKFFRYYLIIQISLFILLVLSIIYNRTLIIPNLLINLLLAYLLMDRIPKDRVMLGPMLMVIILSLINLPKLKLQYVGLVGLFLISFFALRVYRHAPFEPVDLSTLEKENSYAMLNPGNFLGSGASGPFDKNYLADYKILTGSWLTNSPLMIKQLQNFGISAEPHISIIDNNLINEKCLYIDRNNQQSEKIFNELQNYLSLRKKTINIVSKNDSVVIYKIANLP